MRLRPRACSCDCATATDCPRLNPTPTHPCRHRAPRPPPPGANVGVKDNLGRSPLQLATKERVVELLRDAEAKLGAKA